MAAPDYTEEFNTRLAPEMEQQFKSWVEKSGKLKDLYDYDLRGAFAAGLLKPNGQGHLPDTYKKPNHPTFSNESIYSSEQTPGGEWLKDGDKWVFKASPLNLHMFGPSGLEDYFQKFESDSTLLLPQVVQ